MSQSDWEIGRVMGIPIRVHASWFLVFLFMTWTLATGYLPEALPGLTEERYWGMGAIAAILLFCSVLVHELGHSYVAKRYHIPIGQITLFLFGGVAQMGKEPPSPRAEFLIAIAGPIVSVLLGAVCLGLAAASEVALTAASAHGFVVLGGLLGMVNVQLGLFNLIPGFPLDGGRVLRAGLWRWSSDFARATRQAAMFGLGFGLLFVAAGIGLIGGTVAGAIEDSAVGNGGWLIFIGAFLFVAARNARRHMAVLSALDGTAVREVMTTAMSPIAPALSLREAVDQYFVPQGGGGGPVVEDGQVVGLITVEQVQAIPQGLWTWRTVREVMHPSAPELFVAPDRSLKQALQQMGEADLERLVVLEEGKPIGVITQAAIAQFLQLHQP